MRTLKTLIFLIVQQRGDAILDNFSLIERVNESELSYYVQKSLRHYKGNGDSSSTSDTSMPGPGQPARSPLPNGKSAANNSTQPQDRSPLKSVNAMSNGNGNAHHQHQHLLPAQAEGLPEIRDEEDLKRYVLSNAEAMQISLNWEDLKKNAVPIASIEEASRAVEKARQRLESLKVQCRRGDMPNSPCHGLNGQPKEDNLS